MHFSVACRVLLRAGRWIAPRDRRDEWLSRWDTRLAGWQVLSDRGELPGAPPGGVLRLYHDAAADAVALRSRSAAGQAFLHGPKSVLTAGAALLILPALLSQGFRGTRSMFALPPIGDPAALVSIQYPSRANERAQTLAGLLPAWQKAALSSPIAGYRYSYGGSTAWVSSNFHATLGVLPIAGRLLQPGDRDAAVISYPAWRSLYRGNPRVVGSVVRVDGRPYTIVGVLPELFWALSPAVDVWAPLNLEEEPPANGRVLLGAVARLRPGDSPAQFAQELSALSRAASPGPALPVRVNSFVNLVPGRGIFPYLFGTLFAMISAVVLVAKEYPRPAGRGRTYWPFLAVKTTLAILIPLLVWVELAAFLRTFQPALGIAGTIARIVAVLVFLVTCARGLWWSFVDQRHRCPVCLRRLAIPVSMGTPGSVFEPVLRELVCPNGHGARSLPDDETDRPDRWIALDSSWDELFKNKSA